MNVLNITPRGHCYGVVDALVLSKNVVKDTSLPRPIYSLGYVVHNTIVAKAFEEAGIIVMEGDREEMLEKIDSGTVIFTAHGVSPKVREIAAAKGLAVVDTTCPEVAIIHEIVEQRVNDGFDVLYIGMAGHPEAVGTIGINPEKVHLITSLEDAEAIEINNDKIYISNETTMSQWDVEEMTEYLMKKFPKAIYHKDICSATIERQAAVVEQAGGCDLLLVVGDAKSNNSNRLAQVSIEQTGTPAHLIEDISDIKIEWLKDVNVVGVTGGASTPTYVIRETVSFLTQFDYSDPMTWDRESQCTSDKVLPKGSTKEISQSRDRKMEQLRERYMEVHV